MQASAIGGTPGALFAALRANAAPRAFVRGQSLFSEGDLSDRVFLIERGWVKVACSSADGREVVLALRGPGDVVGEMSTVDGRPRMANAAALDDVQVAVVPAALLTRALASDSAAALDLLGVLASRLRDADRKRFEFATFDTLARVASRLCELAERFGRPVEGGVQVDLPLSQEELASWCGSSREATVKALRSLRELGAVTTGRRAVTVRDMPALLRIARA